MTEIYGDILTSADPNLAYGTVVCHQVNCQGVMGSGLAKQVRNRFPDVFEAYLDRCMSANGPEDLLGYVQYCSELGEAGYIVANIFGQNRYGRSGCFTDYIALEKAFKNIAEACPHDVIRIPYKMGCGLGGGDWDTVLAIIKSVFKDSPRVQIWRKD